VLASGTPTVVTLLSGRPYALGSAVTDAAAIVQTFFPGEEGTPAIAGVLSGRVSPSGRLPVSIPAHAGAQPSTYLASPLASVSSVSNIDPSAAFAFGHGIGFTEVAWTKAAVDRSSIGVDGSVTVSVVLSNAADAAAADVVQLYLSDPVASVVRPVRRLVGFARVDLAPGETRTVRFAASADLAAFTGRTGTRIVEPGTIVLSLGRSSADVVSEHPVTLTGPVRTVDQHRQLVAEASIS
jgi:beta-xylosidase